MNAPNPQTVALATGPGFSADLTLVPALISLGYQVECFSMNHGRSEIPRNLLEEAGIFIFRGPLRPSPDETLLTRLLAAKLPESWDPSQRVYGFGRGAWMLFERLLPRTVWKDAFVGQGPWLEASFEGHSERFFALQQGNALPQIPQGTEAHPWIRSSGEVCGWRIQPGVSVSFIDPLAFSDRSQLRNFGYENLAHVRPLDEVLKGILRDG
jgi:hypothetical protein